MIEALSFQANLTLISRGGACVITPLDRTTVHPFAKVLKMTLINYIKYVNEYVESQKLYDAIYDEVFAYLEEKYNAQSIFTK